MILFLLILAFIVVERTTFSASPVIALPSGTVRRSNKTRMRSARDRMRKTRMRSARDRM